MTVQFLARHQWDDSGASRLGHPVPVEQFVRLSLHHTVIVYRPAPTLGDEISYMRRLRVARPDLGLDVPSSFVVFRSERRRRRDRR